MAELRQSLHALVERPPASPVAVEVVATRAARFARRRRATHGAIGLALVAFLAAGGFGLAGRDADSTMDLATHGPRSAGYIAERPGGYVASGTWRLTITRRGQVIQLDSTSHDNCGPIGVILAGDEVRGSVEGPGATLRVGEEFACPD